MQVVAGFICSPLSIVWTGSNGGFGGPHCINLLAFNYYNAAFFILTDILLAAAPVAVLKDSPMSLRRKSKSKLGCTDILIYLYFPFKIYLKILTPL